MGSTQRNPWPVTLCLPWLYGSCPFVDAKDLTNLIRGGRGGDKQHLKSTSEVLRMLIDCFVSFPSIRLIPRPFVIVLNTTNHEPSLAHHQILVLLNIHRPTSLFLILHSPWTLSNINTPYSTCNFQNSNPYLPKRTSCLHLQPSAVNIGFSASFKMSVGVFYKWEVRHSVTVATFNPHLVLLTLKVFRTTTMDLVCQHQLSPVNSL